MIECYRISGVKTGLFVAAALFACSPLAMSSQNPEVQKFSPEAETIFPPEPKIEHLVSGYTWTEGPVWMPSKYLLFADIPANSILKWREGEKEATVFLKPSGFTPENEYKGKEPGSNGMTIDKRGRLTIAGHGRRNVWRLETEDSHGAITVLADSYEGKKLNSPNDVVYKSDGSLYFTDPPYGLETQSDKDPKKELSFNGVYRIPDALGQKPGSKAAEPQVLVKDLPRPNGLAFSPDEKYLYVANSDPKHFWMRYPVNSDGSLGKGSTFFDASSDKAAGSPDGVKVDARGHVYSAGPGGVWIFSPEGQHLATIKFGARVANLNWGGPDAKTLYITASADVYRVQLKIAGAGVRP